MSVRNANKLPSSSVNKMRFPAKPCGKCDRTPCKRGNFRLMVTHASYVCCGSVWAWLCCFIWRYRVHVYTCGCDGDRSSPLTSPFSLLNDGVLCVGDVVGKSRYRGTASKIPSTNEFPPPPTTRSDVTRTPRRSLAQENLLELTPSASKRGAITIDRFSMSQATRIDYSVVLNITSFARKCQDKASLSLTL